MRSCVLPGGLPEVAKKEHKGEHRTQSENGGGEQGAGVFRVAGDHGIML